MFYIHNNKRIIKNYMKVCLKKILQSSTEVLSTKVPPTVGGVVGSSVVASGVYELTKKGTESIIDATTEKTLSPLEIENNLLKSEIESLKERVAILEEPSLGHKVDSVISTIQDTVNNWMGWASKRPQPKVEQQPPRLPTEKKSALPSKEGMEETLAFSLVPENSSPLFRISYLIFGMYMIYYPLFHSFLAKLFSKK